MSGCLGDFSLRRKGDPPAPHGAYIYDPGVSAYIRIHGRPDAVQARYRAEKLPAHARLLAELGRPGSALQILRKLGKGRLSYTSLGALLGYLPGEEWSFRGV